MTATVSHPPSLACLVWLNSSLPHDSRLPGCTTPQPRRRKRATVAAVKPLVPLLSSWKCLLATQERPAVGILEEPTAGPERRTSRVPHNHCDPRPCHHFRGARVPGREARRRPGDGLRRARRALRALGSADGGSSLPTVARAYFGDRVTDSAGVGSPLAHHLPILRLQAPAAPPRSEPAQSAGPWAAERERWHPDRPAWSPPTTGHLRRAATDGPVS